MKQKVPSERRYKKATAPSITTPFPCPNPNERKKNEQQPGAPKRFVEKGIDKK
jgi:hypothetical protein